MPKDKKNTEEPEDKNVHVNIQPAEITEQMRSAYLDYAMSTITSRALPDVRDGLKPVQRRIMYAMHGIGLNHTAKTRKSARITGEVVSKYHPHGTVSVYDTMVKLAQEFNTRYPLVIGQGNYGSIDGDPPAAERYTEAKLSKIAEELLKDVNKETVSWIPNYENTTKEPTVLPARIPNLILNGTLGIAVGMATDVPPHNIVEVVSALKHLIDDPEATNEDLLEHIKGPDFPTGGIVYNRKDIHHAYATGRGGVVVRGEAEIVDGKRGSSIIIKSIPYKVNKSRLVMKIAQLAREKKIEGIKDLRDESTSDINVVIDLKPSAQPQKILNYLYKHTQLEDTFHYNITVLVGGVPKTLSLKALLEEFIKHRETIITRRTKFDLNKAKEREHIVAGLKKALDHIDEIIKLVKKAKDVKEARASLIKKFKFSDRQAEAILEMKIQKLTGLERKELEDELKKLRALIKELEALLKSKKKIYDEIKKDLKEVEENYGDKRRTKIMSSALKTFSDEDLIPDELSVLVLTEGGYVKRTNPTTYKRQKRGGVGVVDLNTKEEDAIKLLLTTSSHSNMLFFSDYGKVYSIKMYEIPEGKKATRGKSLANFISLSAGEKVTSVLDVPSDFKEKKGSLFIVTKHGVVKKMKVKHFESVRQNGLIALTLKKDDKLIDALFLAEKDEIMLFSKKGKAIRFAESDIREMGRTASGVKGVGLDKDDEVVSVGKISSDAKNVNVLTISKKGYGKLTPVKEYRIQKRGGRGISSMKVGEKTGPVVTGIIVDENVSELATMSAKGQVIRTEIKQMKKLGRQTQGVKIMRLRTGDSVASATTYSYE